MEHLLIFVGKWIGKFHACAWALIYILWVWLKICVLVYGILKNTDDNKFIVRDSYWFIKGVKEKIKEKYEIICHKAFLLYFELNTVRYKTYAMPSVSFYIRLFSNQKQRPIFYVYLLD